MNVLSRSNAGGASFRVRASGPAHDAFTSRGSMRATGQFFCSGETSQVCPGEAASDREMGRFKGQPNGADTVRFTPDGLSLLSSGERTVIVSSVLE